MAEIGGQLGSNSLGKDYFLIGGLSNLLGNK